MDNRNIDSARNKRNPFKRCKQCGIDVKIGLFPLVNPRDYESCVRGDICELCLNPRLVTHYQEKTIFCMSEEGAEHKKASNAAARARRRVCQPAWADDEAIKMIYSLSRRITKQT